MTSLDSLKPSLRNFLSKHCDFYGSNLSVVLPGINKKMGAPRTRRIASRGEHFTGNCRSRQVSYVTACPESADNQLEAATTAPDEAALDSLEKRKVNFDRDLANRAMDSECLVDCERLTVKVPQGPSTQEDSPEIVFDEAVPIVIGKKNGF